MRLHPRSVWGVATLAAFILLTLAFSRPQDDPGPIVDSAFFYLPVVARNYPNLFPPPLEARREGWLRKWRETQPPNDCLQASGTPYYLEREPGEAGWLAAVAATHAVPETVLEVHIDEKVAITGTIEYFDPACEFPRLNALQLEVIEVSPDGPGLSH